MIFLKSLLLERLVGFRLRVVVVLLLLFYKLRLRNAFLFYSVHKDEI